MSYVLDEMLSELDPKQIFDPINSGIDFALTKMNLKVASVISGDDFKLMFARFFSLLYIVLTALGTWEESGRPSDWSNIKDYRWSYLVSSLDDVFLNQCGKRQRS